MTNISLLIDYDDSTILQAFDNIEVGGTYSTIDRYGEITYIFVNEIDDDFIQFDELDAFTSEGKGVCMNCDGKFEVRYDDRFELFGVEPVAICPHCETMYSSTCFVDPSEIKTPEEVE